MAQVTFSVVDELAQDNRGTRTQVLLLCADAVVGYAEAQENIARNGQVVLHPRTGAPMPNPYLVVRDRLASMLAKRPFSSVSWGRVMEMVKAELTPPAPPQ